jgi:formylglycine-generating enzyme required for sulfatase activity
MRQLLLALLFVGFPVQALASAWRLVDDPGNPPSLLPVSCCNHRCVPGEGDGCRDSGFGPVAYPFEIEQANVTVAEYLEFLNAVAGRDIHSLYKAEMDNQIIPVGSRPDVAYEPAGPDVLDQPVLRVDLFDAFRYANWVHNGRPEGPEDETTTEDGAYTLLGEEPAWVQRNAGARYFLPNEDEWYKAAFYDSSSRTYSRFSWGEAVPNGVPPDAAALPEDTNLCPPHGDRVAACECATAQGPGVVTDVCAYPGRSAFGLCDTTGNVFEILDTREISSGDPSAPPAGTVMTLLRGGAFTIPGFCDASADGRSFTASTCSSCGFRLARVPAPEPGAGLLSLVGAATLFLARGLFPRPPAR